MPHHRGHAATAPETAGHTIRWAWFYDALVWVLSRGRSGAIAELTLDAGMVEQGQRVLDVGCGTGAVALAAAKRVGADGEVVGVDASPEMVAKARRKAERGGSSAVFEVGLIEGLPFEEGRFERAVSQLVIHHLPAELALAGLREVLRVLRSGGLVSITDFANPSGVVTAHTMFARRGGEQQEGRWLVELLEEAGFLDVEQVPSEFGQLAFVRGRKA